MYSIETCIRSTNKSPQITIDGFGGHNAGGAAPPLHRLHRHRVCHTEAHASARKVVVGAVLTRSGWSHKDTEGELAYTCY